MKPIDYSAIIEDNQRRNHILFGEYDPEKGIGSPIDRFEFKTHPHLPSYWLPITMKELPFIVKCIEFGSLYHLVVHLYGEENWENKFVEIFADLCDNRIKHDFEYWCITAVKIQSKKEKSIIPFKLNKAQRKLLATLEHLRLSGTPIRIILLKARQWGGSTLIQLYMSWIQLFHKVRWHSAIVADVEQQAANIRGMYSLMSEHHPDEILDVNMRPYQNSTKNRIIDGRDCAICIGSMQQPDNLRSFDFAMLHMSEVGLWKKTKNKRPEDLIQSLRSTVPDEPYTFVALESTAKGVGNFFHTEYLAAKRGYSGYVPVFIPWHDIEMYWKKIDTPYFKFIDSMSAYNWAQWQEGASLESINWYNVHKRTENLDDWRMQSEFPGNDIEAFGSTGRRAFAPAYVQKAREFNRKPEFIGDVTADATSGIDALKNISFIPDSKGMLKVWDMPDKVTRCTNRYVVTLDIGGRTDVADFSIITVLDRLQLLYGGVPEAILTWEGHIDQDLAAWKAVQIAKAYNDALFAPETNSLKAKQSETEGDHIITVLDEILPFYKNIYMRTDPEKIRQGYPARYGFHTNVKTKTDLINTVNKALREDGYIEPDATVCDQYDYYEIKSDGTYGAVEGQHDDKVMSRAIALKVSELMPLPSIVEVKKDVTHKTRIINEASF